MRGISAMVSLALAGVASGEAAAAAAAAAAGVPAFIWAPHEGVVSGSNQYAGLQAAGLAQSEVTKLVQVLSGVALEDASVHDSVRAAVPAAPAAERDLVVVFLADELSQRDVSDGTGAYGGAKGALAFLSESVQNMPSSVVLPSTFVDTAPGVQAPWSQWHFAHKHQMVFNPRTDKLETAQAELADRWDGLTGGPIALTVILDGPAESWGKQMETVCKMASDVTADKYMAVFTGAKGRAVPALAEEVVALATERRVLQSSDNNTDNSNSELVVLPPVSSSPDIIFGMLLSLMLFFATFIYIDCMDGVQTPTRFAKRYPPMGKVYD